MDPSPFRPAGIVALLTDFGSVDPYVGILKGVILSRRADAVLVDLTHEVPPQDVRRGAWFLRHCRGHFPPGTIFLGVVDPGVGGARALLLAFDQGQAFLGPDNGLLAPALSPEARVLELDLAVLGPRAPSATFHGRDYLAPAAGELLCGRAPEALARPLERAHVALELPRAVPAADGSLAAEVLFADHYGNLVLSAIAEDLGGEPGRFEVEAGGRRIPVRRTYGEALPGELLALVDSWAALEIARRDGSAAALLGLASGARVTLRRRA